MPRPKYLSNFLWSLRLYYVVPNIYNFHVPSSGLLLPCFRLLGLYLPTPDTPVIALPLYSQHFLIWSTLTVRTAVERRFNSHRRRAETVNPPFSYLGMINLCSCLWAWCPPSPPGSSGSSHPATPRHRFCTFKEIAYAFVEGLFLFAIF